MSTTPFKDHVRRHGLWRTLYRGVMDRLGGFFVIARVTTRPMDGNPPGDPTVDTSLPYRVASREDLYRACETIPDQLDRKFVDEALARGDICTACFVNGEMIKFGWRSYTFAPHVPGVWVKVTKPYRYGYKAYTIPEYRGRHIGIVPGSFDYLDSERGYTHGVAFIETHNFASLAGSRRRKNRQVGYMGYFRLFGRTFPFRTRGVKACGVSFVTEKPDYPSG